MTDSEFSDRVRKIKNVSAFARAYKIPIRTLWRVRSGHDPGAMNPGTRLMIELALSVAKAKK